MSIVKIGTRGSQLALFQARAVAELLRHRTATAAEIVVIKTSGDRLAEAPLAQIGGKRLFVKEIEDALLAGTVDLAVHSSKDMPAALPEGLAIGAVLPREDVRDALVLPQPDVRHAPPQAALSLDDVRALLGPGSRIGTSSVRRSAQLVRLFPGSRFLPIRGNLDTRLRKLDSGEFDAIVLAAAGLRRLQRADRISVALPVEACVPAPGQGIIAVEIRAADQRVRTLVAQIDDPISGAALEAERAVVLRLGGGCQMPIGAYARVIGDTLALTAIVVSADGSRAARAEGRHQRANPEAAGMEAAVALLAQGAGDILADVQRANAPVEGLQP